MDELQDLRDEYENILEGERAAAAVKLITTSKTQIPFGEGQAARTDNAATPTKMDEPSQTMGGARGPPSFEAPPTATRRERDRFSSLERRFAAFERQVREKVLVEPCDQEEDDGGGSDIEPDHEEGDKVWLRSGQTATYPPIFIRSDEKEDALYSEKLIISTLKVSVLPKEACGLRRWTNDLLIQIGAMDRSDDGVLTKAVLFYLKNEWKRKECAHDPLQGGLPRFSRHVARALSSSTVLMTSPDLGAEISRYVNYSLAQAQPVFMGPILATIGKFCSFREEHTAGHHMMSFLMLKPASMSLRDVTQFIRTIEDRLQSTPKRHQPPQEMLYAHLWNDAPGG